MIAAVSARVGGCLGWVGGGVIAVVLVGVDFAAGAAFEPATVLGLSAVAPRPWQAGRASRERARRVRNAARGV